MYFFRTDPSRYLGAGTCSGPVKAPVNERPGEVPADPTRTSCPGPIKHPKVPAVEMRLYLSLNRLAVVGVGV